MIRVTRTEDRSHTIVTVDGELSGESVCVVETCCNQAESDGKPVQLFLRDVTAMDQAGRRLLTRLAAKGVRVAASGLYTSYLVQTLASEGEARRTYPIGTDGGAVNAILKTPRRVSSS